MENPINPPGEIQNKPINAFSLNDISTKSTLTANVDQDCFVTTYDKVKLTLIEYEDAKKLSTNWYSFFCMMISFLIPALTVDFKDVWFIDASFFHAAFWLASICFLVVTIVAVGKRIKKRREIKLDYCLQKIKNGAVPQDDRAR